MLANGLSEGGARVYDGGKSLAPGGGGITGPSILVLPRRAFGYNEDDGYVGESS